MIPALAAAAGAKLAGGIAGGLFSNDYVNQGMKSYRDNVNQGTAVLNAGKDAANSAYSPYTTTGATGATGLANAITTRQQAALPTLQVSNPQNVSAYLDPSMAYTQDQARKQAMAAGVAGGAMGGGMLKALSNNANKMAMTNYNNAYNQMLQSNQQNFGQQQQNYQNLNDYQQQQIQNYGNLAQLGLTANTANQQLQQGYNKDINSNYGDIAANQQSGYNAKAGIWGNMMQGLGDGLGASISNIWGGLPKAALGGGTELPTSALNTNIKSDLGYA